MFRVFSQNAYSLFFRENSRRSRLCSRLADSGNELRRKSRTFPTHCCARNYEFHCHWWTVDCSFYLNLMRYRILIRTLILKAIFGLIRTPILKAVFGWKRCALDSRKYGIFSPLKMNVLLSSPLIPLSLKQPGFKFELFSEVQNFMAMLE